MPLIQEGLEDRTTYSFKTVPVYLQLCSGSWQPASASAASIINSEILDSRILVPNANITFAWDALTSKLNITMQVTVTASGTNYVFNRLGLLRGGDLVSKYNGTFTSTTVINLSTAHTFIVGDRIIYNGVAYTITAVSGTNITIGTAAFPGSGTGFIRSARGRQYAGFVLSSAKTILVGTSAIIQIAGESYAL